MTGTRRILVRIKKGTDGRTSFICERADGTTTWQRQEGGQARFFPRHDLTHYAVETVLGHRQGFYGLVAAGWDLSDFGSPWPRGELPKVANLSEMIVGFLDLERATGQMISAGEINDQLTRYAEENGLTATDPLSEEDLSRVRKKRGELFAQWDAVRPGDALELEFDPTGPVPSARV